MSEDCLYLNVWAPPTQNRKLPVMVWIHGGGFRAGWGHQRMFNGTSLARKGAVIVTINYRLGVFGFFSHPILSSESDKGVSGNYGLLDQIKALQWVQTNIESFGGDPGCVTIFGQSAGAFSINLLRVSPLAKGLFHRAIAQSPPGGVGLGPNLSDAEKLGERFASTLVGNKEDVLKNLRALSTADLLAKVFAGDSLVDRISSGRINYDFGPITDGWVLKPERIVADVPLIIGTTAEEGAYWASLDEIKLLLQEVSGYQRFIEWQCPDFAEQVLKLYPAQESAQIKVAFAEYFGDRTIVTSARTVAMEMALQKRKVFFYCFARQIPGGKIEGSHHGCEIPFVFDHLFTENAEIDSDLSLDQEIASTLSRQWVRFALTGDPNDPNLPVWPSYNEKTCLYLNFGNSSSIRSNFREESCDSLSQLIYNQ